MGLVVAITLQDYSVRLVALVRSSIRLSAGLVSVDGAGATAICVCVCVRARVRACVRACMRVSVSLCVVYDLLAA